MIGAVGLGAVAACVVVLVPMGMAGYHLSRNKMLFFSGALFITLAIGVHLTPYFPSVTDFVNTVSSVVVFQSRRDSCLSHLHDVVWDVTPDVDDNTTSLYYHKSWAWDASAAAVSACGFQKLGRSDAADLLNGSWIVVAGDSQARLVAVALLDLVLEPERMEKIRSDLFKRHSDYQIVADEIGMRLDFFWAPYALNLTRLLEGFNRNRNYPDVLIVASGLWHMLHFTNASDYGASLRVLRGRAASLVSSFEHDEAATGSVLARPPPHLFWIGMPTLINSMLNSEEKRERMTDALRAAYEEQLRESSLVRNGPFLLLDVESLSWNCGVRCTADGMHYDRPVYEAALHIMLNALLIESHQKL
ncbi:protein ALTERED XYLOGLUCAN 9 [Argentina anserina]|uniref:protein ALTERED XYLOGLUCAN 9 n=1 Tax=Argentina anserina TaxID=57926 RepID=UPI0021762D2B|nr:protein ALTERED XYLOGLUCAN 9 [Potentilla anserina]